MGLFKRIFGKSDNKKQENNNEYVKQDNSIKNDFNEIIKTTPNIPENNPDMLEYDIQNWLNNFFSNPYEYSSVSAKAYSSLIADNNNEVNGHDVYTNTQNEKILNQYVEQINSSSLPQYFVRSSTTLSSGRKSFNFLIPDNSLNQNPNYRLYANCEYKDTSRMVYEFLKRCSPNDSFHLKYVSSEYTKNRHEKIVVYTETEEDLNNMFYKFEDIQIHHPELFKKENNLPFMKNFIPGIGYGNQPIKDFVGLNDIPNSNIDKSFNSYIAEILLESLFDTTNKICDIDPEVNKYITQNGLGQNIYRYMSDKYHKSFMQNMVDKVLLLSEKNDLDIKRKHNQMLPRYNNKNVTYDNNFDYNNLTD